MAKCLRCGAGNEWLQGDVKNALPYAETTRERARAAVAKVKMLALLRDIAVPRDYYLPDAAHEWSENARALLAEIDATPPSVGHAQ